MKHDSDSRSFFGVSVKLTKEEHEKLKAIAAKERRPATTFVRHLLQDLIAKHEAEGKVSNGK